MNEFEEQAPMNYIDESVPAMVEQQGDFQDIEQSYQADGTVGADDNGSFLDEDVAIVTADGQEYPAEDGREGGVVGEYAGALGKASVNSVVHPSKTVRARNKTREDRYAEGEGFVSRNLRPYSTTELRKQAEHIEKKPGYAREGANGQLLLDASGRKIKDVTPGRLSGKSKAGIAAGVAGLAAAGAGAYAYSKHKKDQENREGGRFGEGEFDETYEAPYTGEVEEQVVDYSDSVEANYASIQAAVNYAMQDNRL